MRGQVAQVEEGARRALGEHLAQDRAGDDIARGQLALRRVARHEALALRVAQVCALATHRLRDQERLAAPIGRRQHGGMELRELQVGQRRARAPRHRQPSAVAPGGFEVRSQSRPAPPFASTTPAAPESARLAVAQQIHANAAPIFHDQIQRERLLQDQP